MSNDTLTSLGLTEPRMVGATEYAAIYEALSDATENAEEDGIDPHELLLAMLDEFAAFATSMKAQLLASRAPTRCTSTLSGMRCELPVGHGRYHKHNAAGWEGPEALTNPVTGLEHQRKADGGYETLDQAKARLDRDKEEI